MSSARLRAALSCLVFGGIATWQAPMNQRLGESVGTLPAAAFSFLEGAVILAFAVVVIHGVSGLRTLPAEFRTTQLRWFAGGLIGSTYVVVAMITVSDLGTGGLIAASICGTLIGAIAIDWLALVGVSRRTPHWTTFVGCALLLVATGVIAGGRSRGFVPLAVLAAVGIGVLVAFQPPINAKLAAQIGGVRAALAQTFVGVAAICVFTAVAAILGGDTGHAHAPPWWAFMGGVLGAGYVVATLFAVPAIGASGAAAAYIGGGLAFGVAADALGMFGLETVAINAQRLVGVGLMVIGAALVLSRSDGSDIA
jgi:transporter family-2 protein